MNEIICLFTSLWLVGGKEGYLVCENYYNYLPFTLYTDSWDGEVITSSGIKNKKDFEFVFENYL